MLVLPSSPFLPRAHLLPLTILSPSCLQGEYGTEMYFLAKGIIELTVDRLSGPDLELMRPQPVVPQPRRSFGGTSPAYPKTLASTADDDDDSTADSVHVDPVSVAVFSDGSFFGEVIGPAHALLIYRCIPKFWTHRTKFNCFL
jgi:hypothetical protein